jgi:hypothetical protein
MKSSPASKKLPVLRQFANPWTLQQYPSAAKEWNPERKFKEIKKAGFEVVGAGLESAQHCKDAGVDFVCYTDITAANYQEKLEKVKAANPVRVNVQLCDHDTPPKEAVAAWIKAEKFAREIDLAVDLEVHRDTCTETPEKTYEIADLFQKATGRKIDFCWDFSHIAVVKHIYPPYAKRLIERPDLIQRSRQFHFRPFNGHHCQVPSTDGKGNPTSWFQSYIEFVDDLLGCWLEGAKGGEVLYACPEIGSLPSGYALAGFPDLWKDAIYTRDRVETAWKKRLKGFKPKG